MKNFLRIVVGVQFHNERSFDGIGQYILVSNHNSHLDTMILLSSLPFSQITKMHPVAAGDYFNKNRLQGTIVRFFINTVFVDRKKAQKGENLNYLDEIVKSGKSLLIFPEGSRGNPDELQRFKKGVGVVLEKNPRVKVIPCFIDGVGRSLPRGEMLLVPFCIKLFMGKPIDIGQKNLEEINKTIFDSINSLKQQGSVYGSTT